MKSTLLRCARVFATLVLTTGSAWADTAEQTGPRSAKLLGADELASWVLDTNPGLASIQAAAEAAAYRVNPAGSLDDPTLSYAAAPLTANNQRGLNQKIDFAQRIPWPGTLSAREATAHHEAMSVEYSADALRLQIIAQAKSAHAEWRYIDVALNIHHTTQELLDKLIAVTQTQFSAGRVPKQDVLQAEVERTDIDNQLIRLLRRKATIQARINALLNRSPDEPLPSAAPIKLGALLPSLEELQSFAFKHHPELSRLDEQVAASKSRIKLAEKGFYPNFQVGVGYNSLWDNDDKRPSFGVSINLPLDHGKRKSSLNSARAESRRAQWSLVDRRAFLISELARLRAEVVESRASLVLYQDKLVPLALEYLLAAIADYKSGSGMFLNVIAAQRRKLSTDLEQARARSDYARRLAELERWVGGSMTVIHPAPKGIQ